MSEKTKTILWVLATVAFIIIALNMTMGCGDTIIVMPPADGGTREAQPPQPPIKFDADVADLEPWPDN